jgi:lipopolysaccharide export system protein LptA
MRHAENKGRAASKGLLLAAGVAVALTAGAGTAWAQLSQKKGPIDITSDSTDVRDPDHLMMFRGKVEALQDTNRLRSDTLDVYYKKAAPKTANAPKAPAAAAPGGADLGDIDRMIATGNVYYVTPTQVVRGDKAVYTADSRTIVVTGDVVLTQGEDVGRGTRLVIELDSGHSTLECTAPCRPRFVVYQNKTQQGQKH